MNLKAEFTDYTIAGANIIAVEPGNWFSVFKVDVGERDGIHGFPVVTSPGALSEFSIPIYPRRTYRQSSIRKVPFPGDHKPGGGHAIVKETCSSREGLQTGIYPSIDIEVGDIIRHQVLAAFIPKA